LNSILSPDFSSNCFAATFKLSVKLAAAKTVTFSPLTEHVKARKRQQRKTAHFDIFLTQRQRCRA
jgi:hypothetical protein